jgi:hypothetical protein
MYNIGIVSLLRTPSSKPCLLSLTNQVKIREIRIWANIRTRNRSVEILHFGTVLEGLALIYYVH